MCISFFGGSYYGYLYYTMRTDMHMCVYKDTNKYPCTNICNIVFPQSSTYVTLMCTHVPIAYKVAYVCMYLCKYVHFTRYLSTNLFLKYQCILRYVYQRIPHSNTNVHR